DRFMPRQFVNLGDRLAYSNGILVLSAAATGLILAFRANVDSLIHLYVIGVFTAFTLAQAGMVRYWLRTHRAGWRWSAVLNGVGLHVESADAALREALWYARQIAGDDFRAVHVPGPGTDPGIRPRFRELTDIRPDLEVIKPEVGRVEAVIDYLWALPRGESNFVTMIVPEL